MNFHRSYLRFSLRAAFVALTVGCIWLGYTAEQARQQREVTAKIQAFGGGVYYDWQRRWSESHSASFSTWPPEDWRPPGPTWLRKLIGDDFFQRVEGVQFSEDVNDEDFAACFQFPGLKSVGFSGMHATSGVPPTRPQLRYPNVTDEHLKRLTELKQLEEIRFSGTAVTDEGLKCLTGLKRLRRLDLGDTNITDAGLRTLKQIPTLKEVGLERATVTGQGITELMKALPECEVYR